MNKYLRAIGFSKVKTRKDVHKLLNYAGEEPTAAGRFQDNDEVYGFITRSCGKNMGLTVVGTYEEDDRLEEQYYYPYVVSNVISSTYPLNIERHMDRMAFGGIIDDPGMGIAIIFNLNNGLDMLIRRKNGENVKVEGVSLNALCISGKILLPLYKSETQKAKLNTSTRHRAQLVEAARQGDEKAMENLAMEEMQIMQNVSSRIGKEDIYSLVDTCFMPYGLDSNQYAVIGEIQQVEKIMNRITGEMCYQMVLECNRLIMTVMINSEDLLGEPMIGRRFKGEIWLQGTAKLRDESGLQG